MKLRDKIVAVLIKHILSQMLILFDTEWIPENINIFY